MPNWTPDSNGVKRYTGTVPITGDAGQAIDDNASTISAAITALNAAIAAALKVSSNLSDLANAATARTNLGLGSAATHAATDFDTAGAAATVNTALMTHEADQAAHGATSANTAGKIVARDGSGNFAAGTITANLTGHASLDLPLTGGTLTGALNGTSLAMSGGGSFGSTLTVQHSTIADTGLQFSQIGSFGFHLTQDVSSLGFGAVHCDNQTDGPGNYWALDRAGNFTINGTYYTPSGISINSGAASIDSSGNVRAGSVTSTGGSFSIDNSGNFAGSSISVSNVNSGGYTVSGSPGISDTFLTGDGRTATFAGGILISLA